jgi:spermidine/putrescine transport system substrate-binding protein
MKQIVIGALAALALLAFGCSQAPEKAQTPPATEQTEQAAQEQATQEQAPEAAAPAQESASGGEVYVYNWTEYMPADVLRRFEEETGIKVVYSTFDSNEAMYAKLKLVGGEGYDLVVPSTYFVAKMAREGMLAPIDKARLANFGNLNPAVLDKSYDPGNTFSVPYLWGGTGLLHDGTGGEVTSWKDLWLDAFKGRIMLQDDMREVLGIGLLLNGHSINDTEEAHIAQAYETMKTLAPDVLVYNSDNPKMPFLGGETSAGMIWNGEGYVATQENDRLQFVWPREGGILWMDNLVIPAGARNYENALKLIDFLLRPEVSAACCEEYGYPTPNVGALEFLPEELRQSPTVFPPDEVVRKSEFINDIGPAVLLYEKYWEMLRAGH